MSEELSPGPGTAVLVIPMPGGMEAPADTVAAMIAWLFRHGGPRTGEVLTRLERHGWSLHCRRHVVGSVWGTSFSGMHVVELTRP